MAFAKMKSKMMSTLGVSSPKQRPFLVAKTATQPEEKGPKTILVAVYGNDKQFFCRNSLLGKKRKFIEAVHTCKKFGMMGNGMPMVFDEPIANIVCDLFEIDAYQLGTLDHYHGVYTNGKKMSERKTIKVQSLSGDKKYKALFYVYDDRYSPDAWPMQNHVTGYEWRGDVLSSCLRSL
jgi:gamma-glutamylcyclotransferase (GGCT)/AIG2-like uncharacterized protein YtfP